MDKISAVLVSVSGAPSYYFVFFNLCVERFRQKAIPSIYKAYQLWIWEVVGSNPSTVYRMDNFSLTFVKKL